MRILGCRCSGSSDTERRRMWRASTAAQRRPTNLNNFPRRSIAPGSDQIWLTVLNTILESRRRKACINTFSGPPTDATDPARTSDGSMHPVAWSKHQLDRRYGATIAPCVSFNHKDSFAFVDFENVCHHGVGFRRAEGNVAVGE